jgi:hypothetical protein
MLTFVIDSNLNICIQSNHSPYHFYDHNFGTDITKEMWKEFIKNYRSRRNFTMKSTQNQKQYVNSTSIIINEGGIDFVIKTFKGEINDRYKYGQELDNFIDVFEKHLKIRTEEVILSDLQKQENIDILSAMMKK